MHDGRTALGALPNAINSPNGLPAAKQSASASKKRKSTESHTPIPLPSMNNSTGPADVPAEDEDCDQLRSRINNFFVASGMTKTAFARELGIGVSSLSTFLAKEGLHNGAGSVAYRSARDYFHKRGLSEAVAAPSAKKAKTSNNSKNSSGPSSAAAPFSKGSSTAVKVAAAQAYDVSNVYMDGQEDDDVPVFDTCDEIRRKIKAHLKRPGVTQAQLYREIYGQLYGPSRPDKPFAGGQMANFLKAKGPAAGAKLPLFYGAYVYFEKLRVKEGKPKSKHRLGMEEEWGRNGMELSYDQRTP
ncbi:uncharacterized protein C8A04DRAFT_11100 [Dichotomopilus funicola]|uniref:DUF7726 domain-containing protein n=1 Tax=Dichotomopilus funicola TaxID=1934379 RepID=A0AAN6ZP58_9PEZI|nr:hypothetical protein C8A04DRAFT_11100 [Dichotomopilus funicola]